MNSGDRPEQPYLIQVWCERMVDGQPKMYPITQKAATLPEARAEAKRMLTDSPTLGGSTRGSARIYHCVEVVKVPRCTMCHNVLNERRDGKKGYLGPEISFDSKTRTSLMHNLCWTCFNDRQTQPWPEENQDDDA